MPLRLQSVLLPQLPFEHVGSRHLPGDGRVGGARRRDRAGDPEPGGGIVGQNGVHGQAAVRGNPEQRRQAQPLLAAPDDFGGQIRQRPGRNVGARLAAVVPGGEPAVHTHLPPPRLTAARCTRS